MWKVHIYGQKNLGNREKKRHLIFTVFFKRVPFTFPVAWWLHFRVAYSTWLMELTVNQLQHFLLIDLLEWIWKYNYSSFGTKILLVAYLSQVKNKATLGTEIWTVVLIDQFDVPYDIMGQRFPICDLQAQTPSLNKQWHHWTDDRQNSQGLLQSL